MAYRLGNGIWSSVFAVPNIVTDKHLKIASGLSVKVLLLLLRHNDGMETADMAAFLGQSVSDIQDALNFWVQCGVIQHEDALEAPEAPTPEEPLAVHSLTAGLQYQEVQDLPPAPMPDSAFPERAAKDAPPEGEPARKVATISASRRRLTTEMINDMARQDENIEYLLQEAQSVLGKTLTPVATDTVVALYSYHDMQPDLILMLIHYCVSIGKNSMHYIERVAADWMERGIDSHEKAEAEIVRQTQRHSMEGRIKSAFGIDRSLVPSEKKYIQTWLEEYQLDIDLIRLAYERAVELKGKLSFPYINGILANWHAKGIKSPAQAMKELQTKGGASPNQPVRERSYDMSELESMIAHGDI